MTTDPRRGLLIVIEGLDRSGKTTQVSKLITHIEATAESPVRSQKFPDRSTPTGQIINAYLAGATATASDGAALDDHAIHLIFSANRWEARQRILADLARGITVVVDRYAFSGAVYSAAKQLPSLDLHWAWSPEIGLPKPDLVVFFDVGPEVARSRGGYGDERYEREEMQARVRALFAELWQLLERQDVKVRTVDAGQGIDEVALAIRQIYREAAIAPREAVMVLKDLY